MLWRQILPSVESRLPSLIVSGINHGANLGGDILVSGTALCGGCAHTVPDHPWFHERAASCHLGNKNGALGGALACESNHPQLCPCLLETAATPHHVWAPFQSQTTSVLHAHHLFAVI